MFYPIHVNILDMNITVVGAGHIAFRKCQIFLEYGKVVTVVAKDFLPAFAEHKDTLQLVTATYNKDFITASHLVIAATNNKDVNKQIADDCKSLGILVNVADDASLSTFIVPAYIKRGDLLISVSTSGKSPSTTKKIKQDLEKTYDASYANIIENQSKQRRKR